MGAATTSVEVHGLSFGRGVPHPAAGEQAVSRLEALDEPGLILGEVEIEQPDALGEHLVRGDTHDDLVGALGQCTLGDLVGPLGKRTQTGAGSSAGSADEAYDAIRASSTDVAEIASKTGFKPSNIQKVKDHLFIKEHLLDRYVKQGVPATIRRFDSDVGIAQAWNRLRQGTHTADDIKLLKHEIAEAWYMRRHGPSYNTAHEAASLRFPAPGQ